MSSYGCFNCILEHRSIFSIIYLLQIGVMIKNIQQAFNELLDELDWLDDDTKKAVKEKVSHVLF